MLSASSHFWFTTIIFDSYCQTIFKKLARPGIPFTTLLDPKARHKFHIPYGLVEINFLVLLKR